jgi:hypothetical protein
MSELTGNGQWHEDAWRNRLSKAAAERLHSISKDPRHAEDLRLERRLTAALDRLPDAPMPSNFTSRVLQAAAREEAAPRPIPRRTIFGWLPRFALGCVLAAAGFFSWQQVEKAREQRLVHSVATISNVSVPSPDILKDFEVIRALSRTPPADEQLLALMQ